MEMLYSHDGIDVALVSVEVWSAGVILRLAGLPNERTDALDRHYQESLEAWARTGHKGSPPNQPAEGLFDVDLGLSDVSGTSYVLQTASKGGSARMFRAEWSFEPGPPESCSQLTLRLSREGHEIASVDLSL